MPKYESGRSIKSVDVQRLVEEIFKAGIYDGDEFTIDETCHKVWQDFLKRYQFDGYDVGFNAHDMEEYLKKPLAECFALGVKEHLAQKLMANLEGLEIFHDDAVVDEVKRNIQDGIADWMNEGKVQYSVVVRENKNDIEFRVIYKDDTVDPWDSYEARDFDEYLNEQIQIYDGFWVQSSLTTNKRELLVNLYMQ